MECESRGAEHHHDRSLISACRHVSVSSSSATSLCRVSGFVLAEYGGQANGFIVPSNLLLNRIGMPAIYLPTCMIVWGTISASTAAAHNYAGLLAIRFFLGFVEAAYFVSTSYTWYLDAMLTTRQPGCLFFLSSW